MRKLHAVVLLCLSLFLASNVQPQGNSGANNAELNGNYSFVFGGTTGSSSGSSVSRPWEDSRRMAPEISPMANWIPMVSAPEPC